MPDPVFAHPRLAAIYDGLDPDRSDLDHYLALVEESRARSVLDVGCGTGTFACLLAARGLETVGVDPAAASLDVARAKPGAERVRWLLGDATTLPKLTVEAVTMTGNVAQVFLADDDWLETIRGVRRALVPSGWFVFEVRDPARRGWEEWNNDATYHRVDIEGVGIVEHWTDVLATTLPFVTFRQSYRFESDGKLLTSDSTLRFRTHDELNASLTESGFDVLRVVGAPDRPERELVFVCARRP